MDTFLTSDGVRLRYQLQGEGRPLVFIHGWNGSGDDFRAMANRLAKKYKVLFYDQRGHGYSEHPEKISLKRLSQDLRELTESLQLKDCVFAGWSMGVMVIFSYLEQYGEDHLRGLILMDSTPKHLNDEVWKGGLYEGSYSAEEVHGDISLIYDNLEAFEGKFLRKILPDFSDEQLSFLTKLRQQNPVPKASRDALAKLWKEMNDVDYRELVKDITLAVRIFRGEERSLFSLEPAQFMKKSIKKSKLISFPGATHLLVLEKPRQIKEEIERFMEEVENFPE